MSAASALTELPPARHARIRGRPAFLAAQRRDVLISGGIHVDGREGAVPARAAVLLHLVATAPVCVRAAGRVAFEDLLPKRMYVLAMARKIGRTGKTGVTIAKHPVMALIVGMGVGGAFERTEGDVGLEKGARCHDSRRMVGVVMRRCHVVDRAIPVSGSMVRLRAPDTACAVLGGDGAGTDARV